MAKVAGSLQPRPLCSPRSALVSCVGKQKARGDRNRSHLTRRGDSQRRQRSERARGPLCAGGSRAEPCDPEADAAYGSTCMGTRAVDVTRPEHSVVGVMRSGHSTNRKLWLQPVPQVRGGTAARGRCHTSGRVAGPALGQGFPRPERPFATTAHRSPH